MQFFYCVYLFAGVQINLVYASTSVYELYSEEDDAVTVYDCTLNLLKVFVFSSEPLAEPLASLGKPLLLVLDLHD